MGRDSGHLLVLCVPFETSVRKETVEIPLERLKKIAGRGNCMNQLKTGVALNYVLIIISTLVGLLYTPYMLRMMGQSEYGLYSLVASVISYLTILDLGFGNAIVRYTAKYRAEGKKRSNMKCFLLLGNSLQYSACCSDLHNYVFCFRTRNILPGIA